MSGLSSKIYGKTINKRGIKICRKNIENSENMHIKFANISYNHLIFFKKC